MKWGWVNYDNHWTILIKYNYTWKLFYANVKFPNILHFILVKKKKISFSETSILFNTVGVLWTLNPSGFNVSEPLERFLWWKSECCKRALFSGRMAGSWKWCSTDGVLMLLFQNALWSKYSSCLFVFHDEISQHGSHARIWIISIA